MRGTDVEGDFFFGPVTTCTVMQARAAVATANLMLKQAEQSASFFYQLWVSNAML